MNPKKEKEKIEAKNCLEVVGWIFYKDDCDIDIYVDQALPSKSTTARINLFEK